MNASGAARTLEEVLHFPPIAGLQGARVTAIEDLLVGTSSLRAAQITWTNLGLRYAVDHHLLEGAERAARTGELKALEWYRRSALAELFTREIPSSVGPRLIVAPDLSELITSAASETPYYLLQNKDSRPSRQLISLTLRALRAGESAGFGALLGGHAAVISLLKERRPGEVLDSWTMSRLPGTIFLDYFRDHLVLARDLIHEAGHNWLNDALVACNVSLSGASEFYSPWKGTVRPAYGFIHACWAFPLTMIFVTRVLRHSRGHVRDILDAYLGRQRKRLVETKESHGRALGLVTDFELRERLRAVHELAGRA